MLFIIHLLGLLFDFYNSAITYLSFLWWKSFIVVQFFFTNKLLFTKCFFSVNDMSSCEDRVFGQLVRIFSELLQWNIRGHLASKQRTRFQRRPDSKGEWQTFFWICNWLFLNKTKSGKKLRNQSGNLFKFNFKMSKKQIMFIRNFL